MSAHPDDEALVVETIIPAVEDAGALALALRSTGLTLSHKGSDLGQALTDADIQISELFHRYLGDSLIEEETAETLGICAARVMLSRPDLTFVADPIDGSKPFVGGLSSWGTMVAACRDGWPVAGVISLPEWPPARAAITGVDRDGPEVAAGLMLAAWNGRAYVARTKGGRLKEPLRQVSPPSTASHHVGWLPIAAQYYTLDYTQGLFPWCESAFIADAALLAFGRLDATLFNHKLWDLAAPLVVLEALGFRLFHWPDLGPPPPDIIDLFDASFTCHHDLWLVCRSKDQAARLGRAISRAGVPQESANKFCPEV